MNFYPLILCALGFSIGVLAHRLRLATRRLNSANSGIKIKDAVIAECDERLLNLVVRCQAAESDADRLANLINEHVQIARAFAGTIDKDYTPACKEELAALALHQEALKKRPPSTYEQPHPTVPATKTVGPVDDPH